MRLRNRISVGGGTRARDGFHGFRTIATCTAVVIAGACGGDAGPDRSGLPAFCQAALDGVDAFLSSFDPPTDERHGGTAVAAGIGEFAGGMNALVSTQAEGTEHQNFINFMTLVRWGADLESAEPYLAESWEFDWEAGTLTFHLRDDVWWHDGVQTTAEDVAFTFLRATDPAVPFPNTAFWDYYTHGEAGVEVVDSFTVRFRLEPHQEPLDPWRALSIMPKHLLEDVPLEELSAHPFGTQCPVGNGPFRFVEHQQDDRWVFEANPAFPEGLGGRPFIDRYIYRVIPTPATLLNSLLTGEIDLYVGVLPDQIPRIEASEGTRFETFPQRAYDYIGWNERRPQFADPRVRLAMTLALDRQEIVDELLRGYGRVVEAGIPPVLWQASALDGLEVGHDVDRARALLDEAGWEDRDGDGVRENADGVRLEGTLLYNQGNDIRRDVAEIAQARLAEIGVSLQPEVLEIATMIDQITNAAERDFDAFVIGWVTEFRLDDRDIFHSARIDGPYAFSGTRDAEMDAFMDRLQTILPREEALPVWRAYAERVIELQPYTYLYSAERILGIRDRLQGVDGDARGQWVNTARWRLDPAGR